MSLTDNPNEMPAIWCLFSIGLLIVALSPFIRTRLLGARAPEPLRVAAHSLHQKLRQPQSGIHRDKQKTCNP